MHRIDGPGATVDNKFTDGDPVGGVQATVVTDDWLNDVQENIMAVLTAAGVAPIKGNASQLLASITGLVGKGRYLGTQIVTASGTVTKTPGATKWRVRGGGGGGQGGGTQATGASQVATGGGGSAGATAEAVFDVSTITTATAVIGAAGAGAANAANGNPGGSTTLSMGANSLTLPGGPGGQVGAAQSSLPNDGGAAAVFSTAPSHVGALQFEGSPGGGSTTGICLSLAAGQAGLGGSNQYGASRQSGNAVGYCAGGPGARSLVSTGANSGANGAPGLLIIDEYI